MAKLEQLPHIAAIDEVMRVMRRDGAVILTGMMSGAQTTALIDELMPYLVATKPGRETFSGFKTTRTGALAARSPLVRKAILDRRIRAVCDQVLLPNCDRYQVNVTHIIRIMPGEVAQVMHSDRWSWAYLKEIEPQLNTIWALTDFTRENGATQVVPGSWSGRTAAGRGRTKSPMQKWSAARRSSTRVRCSMAVARTSRTRRASA